MTSDTERIVADGLDQEGYVIFPGAIDPEYCERAGREIVAEYDRLESLGWKFTRGGRWMGHLSLNPSEHGVRLWKLIREGGYVGAVERHLGTSLAVTRYVGNMNLPGSRNQEMHQDYPANEERIRFNVLVTETTEGNGAMEIVPRSQTDRFSYRTLHTTGAVKNSFQWTGSPGDLLIRYCTVWHRGTVNHSDKPRPLLGVTAKPVAVPEDDPPCDEPIGFYSNRFYGRHAMLLEFREAFAAPLLHQVRMFKSRESPW